MLARREADLEARLVDFAENAAVGLHQVGSDGTILWANRAELELLGYGRDEYIGRSIIEFHVDRPVIDDILTRLTSGEELHDYEARLRAKDGSIRYVLITSNVNEQDGKFVNTRCFTRDITARKRAELALRERERELASITNSMPGLVAFVDTDRRYRFVNAMYERWFGCHPSRVVGKTIAQVVGAAAYETIAPHVDRALAGETVTFEAEVPYRAGGARHIHATYIPQHDHDDTITGFVSLVLDVSDRKNLERYRATAEERTQRLLSITSALAEAISAEEVFAALVDHTGAAMDASSTGLWILDDDGRSVRLARQVGYAAQTARALAVLPLDLQPSMPLLDALRGGRAVWVPSTTELVRRYPHLAGSVTPGRRYRVACLPLAANGHALGLLGLTIDEEREFTDDERDFLLLVARYSSQALERVHLLEAERQSREQAVRSVHRLSILGQASRAFSEAALDQDERLERIVAEVGHLLGSSTSICLVQPDGRLKAVALHHPDTEAQALVRSLAQTAQLKPGEGISGQVLVSGVSALLPAVDAATVAARAAPAYRPFFERYPIHAVMSAPLRARGSIIGTISAERVRAGESYDSADLELLEGLADRAAAAIETSRLHHVAVEARLRAEELYRFAHAAVASERLDDVFDAALGAIARALGAQRSAILLFDGDGVMRFQAWRGLSEAYRRQVEGHSPWMRDATDPEPVIVEDVGSDESLARFRDALADEGIGSLAFIPLVTRGRLLGKFVIYHGEPHRFSSTEVEVAGVIASHVGSLTARFRAVAELEQTIHYNELFAGVLAHDLRNPLGAIMTAAQLLLMRQEGDGRNARPISRIISSGQRITRMIEQLLDVTRVRVGGGIEIHRGPASLADLCRQAVNELELVHPDRVFDCQFTGNSDGSWDADRLLQVVSNLVANACQHGGAGPIEIRVDGLAPDAVIMTIANEGVIPSDLAATLFDPFRGSDRRRTDARGLGLGLYIVQQIVRAHGGAVSVAPASDNHTVFTVSLPRS